MNGRSFLLYALAASLLAAMALSTPGLAQSPPPTAAAPPPGLDDDATAVPLSLAESLRRALENNLDLVQVRIDPRVAEQNVIVQDAAFDAALRAETAYSEYEREPSRVFDPAGQGTSLSASAEYADRTRFGADYSVGFESSRETGNAVQFEPYYQSGLSLFLNLPLLRGRGSEVTTELLLLARGDLAISRGELTRQAEVTLETVEAAYWELVAARQALAVSRQALVRAGDLLTLNRKKVEVGTLAPIEITQAEAGVASQEETVIVAETALENAEDELLRLMATPPDDPLWSARIRPADEPPPVGQGVDLDAALEQALAQRAEIATARQTLENRELTERAARNSLKPELNLRVNVSPTGNNNEGQVLIDPGPDGLFNTPDDLVVINQASFSESISEIADFNNYFWETGLQFVWPIGNRAAKAGYRIASLNRERAEVSVLNQELNIRVEVRRAVRAVTSAAERVAAARSNVMLQRRKLEAEIKKFENGMSTSFEVLTFQNDLAAAELSEIRALTDYAKALASLERAKGTLLEARGLAIEIASGQPRPQEPG